MLALLVSATASIAGMYLVLTADLKLRSSRYLVRAADASRVALSGLQVSRDRLGQDPGWTGATVSAPELTAQSVTITAESTGIYLASITSVGAVADATQMITAGVRAMADPVLDFNLYSRTTIAFQNAVAGGAYRCNSDVTVEGELDFYGTIVTVERRSVSPKVPPGQVLKVATAMNPPDVSISYYESGSTPLVSVPWDVDLDAYLLERISLRPNSNPYGGTNTFGAYSFNAGGKDLVIRDVYVAGCLLIQNCASVRVERGFHAIRSTPGIATLLTTCDLELRLESSLSEVLLMTDFNGDGDILDVFNPYVEGVVFVQGEFKGTYGGVIDGCVVCTSAVLAGTVDLGDSPVLGVQPVVGFIEPGPWGVVAGSIGEGGS